MFDFTETRAFKFWRRYEHRIGIGGLVAGFTFDLWIAKRPDSVADNLLLLAYLFIAAAVIILLNTRTRREGPVEPLFLLLLLQFCFGGLASNLLVLYGHSGTLLGGALFLGILIALVFGNEYLRGRYVLLQFNIGVYYLLLFTFLIISLPTFVFHSIGPGIFLLCGLASLLVISIFLTILFFTVFRGTQLGRLRHVAFIIAGIFVAFNVLYFLNITPPVPLSLKAVGIYHSLSRGAQGSYTATYEAPPWYVFWRDTSSTYTYQRGQAAYCFSAVFAPSNLTTPVFHEWEWYDPASSAWQRRSLVSFSIVGGRDEGYRGYSIMQTLSAGQWRCNVETENGQLIGRISFSVVEASTTPTLSTATL